MTDLPPIEGAQAPPPTNRCRVLRGEIHLPKPVPWDNHINTVAAGAEGDIVTLPSAEADRLAGLGFVQIVQGS